MPQHNIPKLRFPEFEGEWEITTIEDNFTFKNGLNKEKDFFGKGTPIINFKDVYNLTSIHKKDIKGLVEVTDKEIDNFSVKEGDVLFTRTSETIEDIGMSATLVEEIPNCVFSGFVLRARPINSKFDRYYTSYCFNISSLRKEITTKSSYTTRALTSGTLLNKVSFYYPVDIKEQQKIASFLSSVDKKIEQLQKKKELLEHYKKGMMQKLFSLEIRFKDDNGKDFPEWEEKELGDISYKKSSNISANAIEDNFGKYIIYGATGILKQIDFFREDEEYISIIKDGAGVGRLFICEKESSVLGTMDIIKPLPGVNIYYLYSILQQVDFTKFITGSTIPHIYFKDYSKVIVSVPTLTEQTKIADFLTAIDNKIALTDKELDGAKTFKKGLLQQMFV